MHVQIKIDQYIKNRFFEFKGKKSSSAMLLEMMDFFERNGISPQRNIGDPASALIEIKKGLSNEHVRIIKLLNAYDRDYFKPLSRFLEMQSKAKDRERNFVDGITGEEVQEMVELNKSLEKKIATLEKKLEEKQDVEPIGEIGDVDRSLIKKLEHIKTKLEDFHSSKQEDQRVQNRFYFDAAVLQRFHKETLNDLNDIINSR